MKIRYFKLGTENDYAIWGRKITREKCFYCSDDDPSEEYREWHNPSDHSTDTIPEMIASQTDYDEEEIIELTEEEAFLEMI